MLIKKLLPIVILATLLTACWKNPQNQQANNTNQVNKDQIQELLTNENKPLINVDEKLQKIKQELEKIWYTWEKLQKELENQKRSLEKIAYLKQDARKKYILENKVLPEIIKSKKITPSCTTTNLSDYLTCLHITKTPVDKLVELVPNWLKEFTKKQYYREIYALDTSNLLIKTNDPIAIQAKKEKIKRMFDKWLITKKSACSKLPEEETQKFCESLFKQ